MPELQRPYPRVLTDGAASYGGSQDWFADKNFRACGCGVVACADTILYLTGKDRLILVDYLRYVDSLRRHFPLIPGRGIDGVRLAVGMNACLREKGLALRAGWSASGRRFWPRLSEMLADDLPAILAVGPNFPRIWGKERLPLYCRTEQGGYAEAEQARAHFLTATGLDGEWLRVSSWGRELYIGRADYERYMRETSAPLLTNLLYLRRME